MYLILFGRVYYCFLILIRVGFYVHHLNVMQIEVIKLV